MSLPKRRRLSKWPLNSVTIPTGILDPSSPLLQPSYTGWHLTSLSISDSIRFEDANQILYGTVLRMRQDNNTIISEVVTFKPAIDVCPGLNNTPRQLIQTELFYDVPHYLVLDKIHILQREDYLHLFPHKNNVEEVPCETHSKHHVAPGPSTFYCLSAVRANNTLWQPTYKLSPARLTSTSAVVLRYQKQIRDTAAKIHSHKYAAPRYVRQILTETNAVLKTPGNLVFQHVKNVPGDVALELLKNMKPARKNKHKLSYSSPKSFTSLGDLQGLFGYPGISWCVKEHVLPSGKITSFVPDDSVEHILLTYDIQSQTLRFRFECIRKDDNRVLDSRGCGVEEDLPPVPDYDVILESMDGKALHTWTGQPISETQTLSAARINALKFLDIPSQKIPRGVPPVVWYMRVEFIKGATSDTQCVSIDLEHIVFVQETYADGPIRIRFNPSNMLSTAEWEEEQQYINSPPPSQRTGSTSAQGGITEGAAGMSTPSTLSARLTSPTSDGPIILS